MSLTPRPHSDEGRVIHTAGIHPFNESMHNMIDEVDVPGHDNHYADALGVDGKALALFEERFDGGFIHQVLIASIGQIKSISTDGFIPP